MGRLRRLCGPRGTAVTVVLAALTGIASPLSVAGAAYITGYAHVSDTFTVGPLGSDDHNGTSDSGAAVAGTVTLGGGTAAYNLYPDAGTATISGKSATVSFNDWLLYHRESQADAYMQISARFTVEGAVDEGGIFGSVRVNWSGALMPNTDFESQYAGVFGAPTVTSWATFDLLFRRFDDQGGLYDEIPVHYNVIGQEGVTDFQSSRELGMLVYDDLRTFGFVLTIGGVGLRGGGFNFIGSGSVGPTGPAALLAATTGDTLLDTSFFEVVVELPPGLSITTDQGHFIRHVTVVPEPAALPAFAAAIAGCYLVRRRGRGC